MSMVNIIRIGFGFLCMILLLHVAIHYYLLILLKKLEDDLNKASAELEDISDQVAKIANRP